MDTQALADAAGLDFLQLNTWLAKNLVPYTKPGRSGRKRLFGSDAVSSVFIMAELVRFGLSAPMAAQIAAEIHQHAERCVVITQLPAPSNVTRVRAAYCQDEAEIPQRLGELRALAEAEGEPGAAMYAVMDVEMLRGRLHAAQAVWAQQQQEQAA